MSLWSRKGFTFGEKKLINKRVNTVTSSKQACLWCWGSLAPPVGVFQDWEVRYHRDTPLTPRQDVNAPDLYIPSKFSCKWQHPAGLIDETRVWFDFFQQWLSSPTSCWLGWRSAYRRGQRSFLSCYLLTCCAWLRLRAVFCLCVCVGSVQRFWDCVRAPPSCGLSLRSW